MGLTWTITSLSKVKTINPKNRNTITMLIFEKKTITNKKQHHQKEKRMRKIDKTTKTQQMKYYGV